MAVVTNINSDGTMTIKEANKDGNGTITVRTVPINSATGFYNSTDLAKQAKDKGIIDDIYRIKEMKNTYTNFAKYVSPNITGVTSKEINTIVSSAPTRDEAFYKLLDNGLADPTTIYDNQEIQSSRPIEKVP